MRYVIITPARNESHIIEKTILSVISQTLLPECWVIVDDGSTDGTADIVKKYSDVYPWIVLVSQPPRINRSFAGKATAVESGLRHLKDINFDIMGNLDADVSFAPGYLEFVLNKFDEDSELGIAGTPFTEDGGYDSSRDSFEGDNYVAGPCQIFRYDCYKDVGGYVANEAGGVDWIAVMSARMKGWKVRCFPEMRFHHHRTMGTAERTPLKALFSYGEKDYYLGGSPVWQLFRVGYRITKKPYFMGGCALLLGYSWAALRRTKKPVSVELERFHRSEQMKKLQSIIMAILRFKRVDKFNSVVESK